MLVRKSFRYRVYPTDKQIIRLAKWDNALRFLWNLANEQRLIGLSRPRAERVFPTAFDQINQVTELRAELPWLADVPRDVSTHILIELDKAWQRCFKKISRTPRWKRKGSNSLSFTDSKRWRLDGSIIRFPKLGNLRGVIHRPLEGKPKTCTLKCDVNQWFVCIVCEIEITESVPRDSLIVAIDRGVINAVGDSTGKDPIPNPRFYERSLCALVRAQRSVVHKKKGSKNREKAKLRVAKIHRKVRRQREHFLHTLSSRYAKSHGVVVLEKLNTIGMTKSAAGTVKTPGHNVRQKAKLNRGILDAAWGRFEELLKYKLEWSGGRIEYESAIDSSRTCSVATCKHVDAKSRVSQSVFRCTACGHTEHADLNAPKVLLQRYEARVNRSGQLGEGSPLEGSRRTKKRVVLRVPRRRTPESIVLGRR